MSVRGIFVVGQESAPCMAGKHIFTSHAVQYFYVVDLKLSKAGVIFSHFFRNYPLRIIFFNAIYPLTYKIPLPYTLIRTKEILTDKILPVMRNPPTRPKKGDLLYATQQVP
jgi:hypothetical protein